MLWYMQYHVILDRIITSHDCICNLTTIRRPCNYLSFNKACKLMIYHCTVELISAHFKRKTQRLKVSLEVTLIMTPRCVPEFGSHCNCISVSILFITQPVAIYSWTISNYHIVDMFVNYLFQGRYSAGINVADNIQSYHVHIWIYICVHYML